MFLNHYLKVLVKWVLVSLTGKVSYRRARDLGLNPIYTINQLISWPDGLMVRAKKESYWLTKSKMLEKFQDCL